ncbi:uncharacterized protein B0T23DRAFT_429214 [Neurospora hispaniola]|uniref:Uncharacterized protein n=1 Tax=Neurospora hispaniola TaxID=588809 RepID=A0AAJ0MRU4_9PEZI|nr:hypothetical protein B0T23DRAFT_429214 [Neurospora hispaniola]
MAANAFMSWTLLRGSGVAEQDTFGGFARDFANPPPDGALAVAARVSATPGRLARSSARCPARACSETGGLDPIRGYGGHPCPNHGTHSRP